MSELTTKSDFSDHESAKKTIEVIIHDDIGRSLKVASEEPVKMILNEAIKLFGLSHSPHMVSLFTDDGKELHESETAKQAGIISHQKLVLRPSLPKQTFDVIVIYNGLKKPLRVKIEELIKTVLQNAIALFGSPPNPHLLSLFTEAGRELPEAETVKQVGLHPDEKLLLRPSAVKGG
jgi:hypothetical protein